MPHVHWYVVHILVRSNARGFYKMVRNKDMKKSEQKKNCYHLQLSEVATVQVVLTCPYASKIHPFSQIYTY